MGIPPLPIAQPIEKPSVSLTEARRVGETVSEVSEESQRIALRGLQREGYIRNAQQHVDILAAKNDLDTVHLKYLEDLAKTANSRDVPDVLNHARDNYAYTVSRWSGSPAAREIQMEADSHMPAVEHYAQVRQIDLLGKENDVALAQLSKGQLSAYAEARSRGSDDDADKAYSGYAEAIHGSVAAGLMTDADAQIALEKFRVSGQELEIENAISNPNPKVNQAIADKLDQKGAFPDLAQKDIDQLKLKAQGAFYEHEERAKKIQNEFVLNTELPGLRQRFMQPNGTFDLDGALKEVRTREDNKSISVEQGDMLRQHLDADAADLGKANTENANKLRDHVMDLYGQGKIGEGLGFARQHMDDFERAHTDYFSTLVNSGRAYAQWERTEGREQRGEARQKWEDAGWQHFASLSTDIEQGKVIDPTLDVWALVAKKELTPPQARELLSMYGQSQQHAEFKQGLSLINSASMFANTDEGNAAKAKMASQFTQIVRQEGLKGDAILEQAKKMTSDAAGKSTLDMIENFFSSLAPKPFTPIDMRSGKPVAMPTAPPVTRPANVPADYVHKDDGPKGPGWYKP